jgi:hypothetical protein
MLWELIGRFRCSKCGALRRLASRALRSPFRCRVGVCRDCLGTWLRTGSRCGRCWYPVPAVVEAGLLLDKGVFAHLDCGATPLV